MRSEWQRTKNDVDRWDEEGFKCEGVDTVDVLDRMGDKGEWRVIVNGWLWPWLKELRLSLPWFDLGRNGLLEIGDENLKVAVMLH